MYWPIRIILSHVKFYNSHLCDRGWILHTLNHDWNIRVLYQDVILGLYFGNSNSIMSTLSLRSIFWLGPTTEKLFAGLCEIQIFIEALLLCIIIASFYFTIAHSTLWANIWFAIRHIFATMKCRSIDPLIILVAFANNQQQRSISVVYYITTCQSSVGQLCLKRICQNLGICRDTGDTTELVCHLKETMFLIFKYCWYTCIFTIEKKNILCHCIIIFWYTRYHCLPVTRLRSCTVAIFL